LAPIPEGDESGDRGQAAGELAHLLGIPMSNILDTPPVMSKGLFAKNTHLSEHGREVFSHILARSLAAVVSGSATADRSQ
jgi:hypothetical protein